MASTLQARGVGPGTHVAVLGPTTRQLVTALRAIWLAGGTVVALPLPMRLGSIDAIIEAAEIGPTDRAVSWLPLYHDMGLIGLLMTPMLHGFELVLGAPQDFLAAPARWLEWISEFRGTITAGPNFSYALAARALRRAGRLDLSSWRLAVNGAEPV